MILISDSLKKTVTVNRLCWLWAQILCLQVTLQWCTLQHTYWASLMFYAKSKHFDLCLEIQTCNYWTIMPLPWQRKSISPDTQSCWAPLIRASTHFTSTTKTIFKSKLTYCHFSNSWYGNNKMQFPRKPWCRHLTLYLQHTFKKTMLKLFTNYITVTVMSPKAISSLLLWFHVSAVSHMSNCKQQKVMMKLLIQNVRNWYDKHDKAELFSPSSQIQGELTRETKKINT